MATETTIHDHLIGEVVTSRSGTTSDWETEDPILKESEFGIDLDSGKFKIGDGVSKWSELSYFISEASLGDLEGVAGPEGPEGPAGEPGPDVTNKIESIEHGLTGMLTIISEAADFAAFKTAMAEVTFIVPPGPVTSVELLDATTTTVTFGWVNPEDDDFEDVVIRRLAGETAPSTIDEGDLVATLNKSVMVGSVSYQDALLTADTTYSYSIFARNIHEVAALPGTLTVTTDAA